MDLKFLRCEDVGVTGSGESSGVLCEHGGNRVCNIKGKEFGLDTGKCPASQE